MGSLAPPLDHPDYATVKVLSTILGGGMAGRLFAELRDKRALADGLLEADDDAAFHIRRPRAAVRDCSGRRAASAVNG